jgi:hypothetical protein
MAAEMTLEQQRALAMASARLRLQQSSGEVPGPRRAGALVDQIPGSDVQAPASTDAPERPESGFFGKLMAPLETAVTLGTSAITAPIVEGAKIYGALTSGKFGTQQGIKAGEATGRKVQQFFQPQVSPESERQTAAISNALAQTGLQGVPLNMMANMATLAGPAVQQVAPVIKAPIEARQKRVQEARVAKSYKDAPLIDAAEAGFRQGLVANPAESNPTLGNRMMSVLGGTADIDARLSKYNVDEVQNRVRQALGVAANEKLDADAIERAIDRVSAPYDVLRKIPTLQAPDASIDALKSLKKQSTIGGEAKTTAINNLVDDAVTKLQQTTSGPFSGVGGGPVAVGRSGAMVLDDIRSMRREAQATYQSQKINPDPLAVARADTQMAIANILEDIVDANAPTPKVLSDLKSARTEMAQIYDHARALDYATNTVDPMVYAKLLDERKGNMTGVGADIGKFAAKFPQLVDANPATGLKPRLTRSGLGGTLGFIAGGVPGAGLGMLAGYTASAAQTKRMMSPAYQRQNAIPQDFRPIPSGLRPVEPNTPINALTPFDYSQQAFTPPNFVMQGDQYGPRVVPGTPQAPIPNTLGYDPNVPSTAQVQMNRLRAEDVMDRNFVAQRVAAQEAQQAAAEAAARRPARGGVELVFDTAGNLVEAPTAGAGGVLPSALESAVGKMSGQMVFEPRTQYETVQTGSYLNRAPMTETRALEQLTLTPAEAKKYALPTRQSQAFAMTAEEKIAWNKAKADIAEVAPGFKALSDKAVAEKLMDRQWLEDAIVKAEQKAKLQDQIIARANNERARQAAMIEREKLTDALETLEEQFRKARPVKTGGQGPKTRAFQRNMLTPEQEIQNALAR